MGTSAHAGVFAFGVFAHDDPVQIFRGTTLQGRVNAGQDARGTYVGVLVKALTNFET